LKIVLVVPLARKRGLLERTQPRFQSLVTLHSVVKNYLEKSLLLRANVEDIQGRRGALHRAILLDPSGKGGHRRSRERVNLSR
jgi:hypothetical protein